MKLLFNEKYGSCNYYWYQLGVKSIEDLATTLEEITKICLESNDQEVQYYFYTKEVHQDAIGDNVRTTLMVSKKNNKIDYNLNVADSIYATKMDVVNQIKGKLEQL